MDAYAEWFAKRLNDALDGRSQAEIARLMTQNGMRMTPTRLGHYFTGRRYPDPPILEATARGHFHATGCGRFL